MDFLDEGSSVRAWMRQMRADFIDVSVRFQITDLELASSFLDRAEGTRDPVIAARNRRHARRALRSVERFLRKLRPTAAQQIEFTERLATLTRTVQRSAGTGDSDSPLLTRSALPQAVWFYFFRFNSSARDPQSSPICADPSAIVTG